MPRKRGGEGLSSPPLHRSSLVPRRSYFVVRTSYFTHDSRLTTGTTMPEPLYWCPRCEQTYVADDLVEGNECPTCGTPTNRISWLTAALRKVGQGTVTRS